MTYRVRVAHHEDACCLMVGNAAYRYEASEQREAEHYFRAEHRIPPSVPVLVELLDSPRGEPLDDWVLVSL